ncbi:hypothetical protein ACFFS2_35935 [Streptomyces aurantiacus]|uniref:Uncharacterized protein n=1 Tax=Streptomyces aurantiacus TaxID=47760 RepID=A0A7G1PAS3_9ACTN|nr:hypothetical protein [Streptomyces aurantiacus]BCL32152.1 hypothetical protein GCM10017557_70110 [Streptomyces aurantiacus]
MNEIADEDVPALLLRTVPESAPFIADKYGLPAERAVLTQDAVLDLYEVLTECFTTPVLMPQLQSSVPDAGLLQRCWDFVEPIVDHSSNHVRGAVYFEVLEPLLNAHGLIERSWPYMKERTRQRTLLMLHSYGTSVPGVTS